MNIGIVGLGRMGSAMSQRLRQQGFEIVGWDHSGAATQAAAAAGLRIAAHAAYGASSMAPTAFSAAR
jgi:3-hydroxyisobutyrate dehydrogenase-like beta-hydroxyacid dehydrogenase